MFMLSIGRGLGTHVIVLFMIYVVNRERAGISLTGYMNSSVNEMSLLTT